MLIITNLNLISIQSITDVSPDFGRRAWGEGYSENLGQKVPVLSALC